LVQGKLSQMMLTSADRARCAQVRFFIYSPQPISKSTLGDKYFRAMIRVNDKPGEETPVLSFKMIDKWIQAEFDVFLLYLRYAMALKSKQAKGNRFAQGQHDGGTLKNRIKFQVQALQWVCPDFKRNFVVVVALSTLDRLRADSHGPERMIEQEEDCEGRALSSPAPELIAVAHTDANVAKDFARNVEAATGLKFDEVVASTIQDGAAGGVASHLSLLLQEKEVCNMHSASKIGAAALGYLVRTRLKKVIDPFPAGKALCARVLALAKVFSWSKARIALARIARTVPNVSTAPAHVWICARARECACARARWLTSSPLLPLRSHLPRPRSRPTSRSKCR
jgi:hypothetical protein